MGRIKDILKYIIKPNPSPEDYVIGTDKATGKTVNFPVSAFDVGSEPVSFEVVSGNHNNTDLLVEDPTRLKKTVSYPLIKTFIKGLNLEDGRQHYMCIERYRSPSYGRDTATGLKFKRSTGYKHERDTDAANNNRPNKIPITQLDGQIFDFIFSRYLSVEKPDELHFTGETKITPKPNFSSEKIALRIMSRDPQTGNVELSNRMEFTLIVHNEGNTNKYIMGLLPN